MAATLRRAVLRGSALTGAAVCGVAYIQRLPRDEGDHRLASRAGAFTRVYRNFIAPIIMKTDAETAHISTLLAGQAFQSLRLLAEPSWTGATPLDWLLRPVPSVSPTTGPSLRQELFDGRLCFESPVGVAAGFDKNAVLVPLYRLGVVPGLGFSEVGSVSAQPSEGNAKPRCFRLPSDEAVINRMGLNNEGCEAVARRLQEFEALGSASRPAPGRPLRAPVGVNIAKTHSPEIMGEAALSDFVTSFRTLSPFADFMVINVSCPNTAEGKTFEEPDTLRQLLEAVSQERGTPSKEKPPVLVKLSAPPDTEAGRGRLRELVETAMSTGIVDGFVISNTAPDREGLLSEEGSRAAKLAGRGGLSGRPIRRRSLAAIRSVYSITGGRVPVVGVGGIDSADAAYAAVRAGASLVEVYTGLVYAGPGLPSDIHIGLRRLLERDGFTSIADAVGADTRTAL